MRVHLSQEETDLLLETLEHSRHALVAEIARTDNRTYRGELKARESILEGLLVKLTTPPPLGEDSQEVAVSPPS